MRCACPDPTHRRKHGAHSALQWQRSERQRGMQQQHEVAKSHVSEGDRTPTLFCCSSRCRCCCGAAVAAAVWLSALKVILFATLYL
jgi:hypothetical protein